MSKPDDIPQDVWEAATAAYRELTVDIGERHDIEIIARAIMAERERAIKIMSDFPEIVHHPAGPAYGAGFSAAVMQMRIAIRKGIT